MIPAEVRLESGFSGRGRTRWVPRVVAPFSRSAWDTRLEPDGHSLAPAVGVGVPAEGVAGVERFQLDEVRAGTAEGSVDTSGVVVQAAFVGQ